MNDQKFISTSPRKIKDENMTFNINASVVNFNFDASTAGIKYNDDELNKNLEKLSAEEPVLENKSPVLKRFTKIQDLAKIFRNFRDKKSAANKLIEDKNSSLAARLDNNVSPSASGYAPDKKLSFVRVCADFDTKTEIDKEKNTSANGAIRKDIMNSMNNLKTLQEERNQNAGNLPTPTSLPFKTDFTPYYYRDLETMPRKKNLRPIDSQCEENQ